MKVYHIPQVDNQYQLMIGTIKNFIGGSVSEFGMYTARMLWFSTHKSSRLHNPHSPDDLLLISDFLLETGQEILYLLSLKNISRLL